MPTYKDYYAILGITQTATDKDIRQHYRQLVRTYHPDVNPDSNAAEKFTEIQEAYETLSDPLRRREYEHWRSHQGLDRSSALSLQVITSEKSLRPLDTEQAFYVVLNIMPTADLPAARLPINLALVIDRSTSMQGRRLQQVKEAIRHVIDALQSEDSLSLVTFSDRAQVLLPSRRNIDKAMAKSIVSTIQPNGGTEMLTGLTAGFEEIKRYWSKTSINHVILLTDGRTYGDERGCLERARWAGANQITLSAIGIGTDWNEDLLDEMAAVSGGTSIYIDSPDKIQNIFDQTLRSLESVVARRLKMTVNPSPYVQLHEVYQIKPQISRFDIHTATVMLGALSTHQEKSVLLEFRIQKLTLGQHRLLRLTVEGDMPGQSNHRPWDWVELVVHLHDTAEVAGIPSAVTDVLKSVAIYKMQEKVHSDLTAGQVKRATQRLEIIATRLLDLGEVELSRAALLEAGQLARTQTLSEEGRKKIRYGTRALSSS
ncbi:MAG: VWA domain-containing protein [Anaerolineaceae bacterium]|nr:VWA domain-containing protein [Anaerolineaceae bacterium]MCB9100768.1 VWA domain-containing protein [Anaerolineales bacterium]